MELGAHLPLIPLSGPPTLAGLRGKGPSGPGGFGLVGMAERVSLVGGNLQVHSRPGGGSTVRVEVPVQQEVTPVGGS